MSTFRRRESLASVLGVDASRLGDQPLSQGVTRFPFNFRGIEASLRETASRSHGWLRNWLPRRTLVLQLDDRPVRFAGLAEFEFSLAGRTEFPVNRIGELLALAPVEIKRLATNIRQVEKRFADVLAEALDEPGAIGYLLRQMDLKLFSQDHGWRELVQALNTVEGSGYDDFKKIALVKYMQYLGSRQEVLRTIYLEKKYQRENDHAGAAFDPLATYAISAGLPPCTSVAESPAMHETAIFDDMTRILGNATGEPTLEPLPRGETICMNLRQAGEMALQISRQHDFRLVGGTPMRLLDPTGAAYVLAEGRNVIGRHAGNEVVVDAEYRSISRRHLVIEPLGADFSRHTRS